MFTRTSICVYWLLCILMAILYILIAWDGTSSLAFVFGQIAMGVIGLLREYCGHCHTKRLCRQFNEESVSSST